ncbi:MAG TPA: hypothetical protein VFO76_01760 [Candidatus Kapabacteria bacterium]|nr:hypothetical protein [Candidatus Kapabacteria bacterium]
MPLAVGNEWHYHFMYHYGGVSDTSATQENRIRVIKDTIVGDERWSMILTNCGDTTSGESFVTNRTGGLYRFFRKALMPSYDLPYPATVGTTVVRRDTFNWAFEIDSLYVQSTNKLVTVPAGTFSTFLYNHMYIFISPNSQGADTTLHEEYYAPGIGFIKGLYYNSTSKVHPNEEVLMDYKLY